MKNNKSINHMKGSLFVWRCLSLVVCACLLAVPTRLVAQEEAEQTPASGKVFVAASQQVVVGAKISVVGRSISVFSDEKGTYKLNLPSTQEILLVSAPGYSLREVAMRGQSVNDIALYSDVFSSSYGDVQTVNGTESKSFLSNAISEATGFKLSTSTSVETDIQSRLGADVRTITRSGQPGIGASMFIRGMNSLNANAQALIVVDGVIWDNQLDNSSIHLGFFSNPLSSIDVKDIESITVLKDGTSIYGSKASNGVILINTVRGKSMATQITASLMFGLNEKPSLPRMMDAAAYRVYASDQVQGLLNYGYTAQQISALQFLNEDPTTSYYKSYHNDTDWADEVYRDGMVQSYSVGVNGGDNIALYNLSMGFMKNEGSVRNTSMERFNARFNSDIQMSSNMFAKVNLALSRSLRDLRDDGINSVTSPGYLALVKAPILASHEYIKSTGALSPKLADYDKLDPLNYLSNPIALIENAMGTSTRLNFNLGINPYYKINKNVTLGTTFAYGLNKVKESFFVPEKGLAPRLINNSGFARNEVRDLSQRQVSVFSDTRLEWKCRPATDHSLHAIGGFRFLSDTYESDIPQGYNTGNDNIKVLLKGLDFKSTQGNYKAWKSMSWYGNIAYDYQKKYFLTAAASIDASSRFGTQAKDGFRMAGQTWALFPSVSGAWIVSNERFMAALPVVSFLKVRASYGLTGNDDIDNYANRSYFTSSNYMGRAVGLKLANIQNKAIQWETTAKLGAGIDLSLFNERLFFSADVFNNKTRNLLTPKLLDPIAGIESYWSNGGELTNKGYEFSFNAKLLNLPSFKWELGASMAHYKNEITALPDGSYTSDILGATILTAVGQPVGSFYGYKTNGVIASTQQAQELGLYRLNANGTRSYYTAGDVLFVDMPDANGSKDGMIGNDDKRVIGNPHPDLYGTVTSRFSMKRLTLDVFFSYSYGNDVYNYLRSQLESGSTLLNQTTAMMNRWTTEGQQTSMPKAVYGDPMGNSVFSDRWIEDGSYLRLKTITLSYELPLNLPYLQGLTVWASANNLYTWTKYLGSDPEFSLNNRALYQGIDAGLSPQGRSYFMGVKINL